MGNMCGELTQPQSSNRFNQSMMFARQFIEKDLDLEQQIKAAKKIKDYEQVIGQIYYYNYDNLIIHLSNQRDKRLVSQFIDAWSRLKNRLQELDMIYQNLIVKDFLRPNLTYFQQPNIIHKSNIQKIPQIYQHYINKGKFLYSQRKIALLIFTPEHQNDKQIQMTSIYKSLEILLYQITAKDKNDTNAPFIVIYADTSSYIKVREIMKKSTLRKNDWIIVMKKSQFVLNQEGKLCLKAKDLPDLVQTSFGNDDFQQVHFQGQSIRSILQKKSIQYVTALELEYFNGFAIDNFFLGYFDQNSQSFDVLYKCNKSYQKPSKTTQKIVFERFGKIFLTDFKKEEKKNYFSFQYLETKDLEQNVFWGGYFVFRLDFYKKINSHLNQKIDYRQFIQIRKEKINFWNPEIKSFQINEECIVFCKPLSNLFLRLDEHRACGIDYEPRAFSKKQKNMYNTIS